jgi:hypothetical protein
LHWRHESDLATISFSLEIHGTPVPCVIQHYKSWGSTFPCTPSYL